MRLRTLPMTCGGAARDISVPNTFGVITTTIGLAACVELAVKF